MATRQPITNDSLPEQYQQDVHNIHDRHFTRTCRGVHTVDGLFALIEDNIQIPPLADPSVPVQDLALSSSVINLLNELHLTHASALPFFAGPMYNPAASYLTYQTMLSEWNNLMENLGRPISTDDAQLWDLHQLILIEDAAQKVIDTVEHAVLRHVRHVQQRKLL